MRRNIDPSMDCWTHKDITYKAVVTITKTQFEYLRVMVVSEAKFRADGKLYYNSVWMFLFRLKPRRSTNSRNRWYAYMRLQCESEKKGPANKFMA